MDFKTPCYASESYRSRPTDTSLTSFRAGKSLPPLLPPRLCDASTVSGPQGPVEPAAPAERPIDPNVRIGHVHLRTADIDRVRDFYVGILGFDVVFEARDVPGWGTTGDLLFVAAGGYHHHLGFNTWKSAGGPPQPDGVAGLHHVALLFSTRAELARAVRRLVDAGIPLRQLTDHGTHEAIYLSDPDGNDLELAWDRPRAEWPSAGFADSGLDLDDLLGAAG